MAVGQMDQCMVKGLLKRTVGGALRDMTQNKRTGTTKGKFERERVRERE